MALIRDEVVRRQAPVAALNDAASGRKYFSPKQEAHWQRIRASLNLAEQNAHAGTLLPEMGRFRGLTRKFARLAARAILYLGHVFTNPQRRFNVAILAALRDLHYTLRQWELACYEQQEGERHALSDIFKQQEGGRQALSDLLLRIRTLERDCADLQARSDGGQPPERAQPASQPDEKKSTGLNSDAWYLAFEERFRGSREEIKKRLRVYLPLVHNTAVGKETMPVLDLGCGRGEWLELLRDEGLRASGVDASAVMVERSRQYGLDVCRGDALAHLRALPDASLGGVCGFHIIEHLPFATLIELLDETMRVLKPGGLALFETPNPENVLVGCCSFYLDPTHIKPLPSPLVRFLAEYRGLSRVEVLELNPSPETRLSGSDLAERFNRYFYGPCDYAVIGWKV